MAKQVQKRIVLAEDNCPDCVRYFGAGAEPPDAIMVDLNLPRVDGFELLGAVRRDRRYASVPVAVLTSSRAERDRQQCLEMGANAFITKPSKLDDFLQKVGSEMRRLLGVTVEG